MHSPQLDRYFADHREAHLAELKEFLAIPSISSLSEHKEDMKKGADWLAEALKKAGLENVKIDPTAGHPVVYADWLHAPGKPTILMYGHYDVQPVDPLHLWETAPFEATIRDEKIFARGASDDKGQVFMHVKAVEALLKETGELPVNIKFLIEGEEEIGSPNLDAYVEENKEALAADVIVISDTGMQGPGQPAVCYGLRGLAGIQIDVIRIGPRVAVVVRTPAVDLEGTHVLRARRGEVLALGDLGILREGELSHCSLLGSVPGPVAGRGCLSRCAPWAAPRPRPC